MVQVYGEQGHSAQVMISFPRHTGFFICVGKQAPLVVVTGDLCLVRPTCRQAVTGYVISQHPDSIV